MRQSIKTKMVKIGNSRGIRIPKAIAEELGLADEIEFTVEEDHLEVRPGRKPRAGWADAFREMAKRKDDQLLDETAPTKWESEEWNW